VSGDGFADLDAMIRRVRSLGGGEFLNRAAAAAAPLVQEAAKATAAAGTTPTGEAWAPRKKDGGRAMANAAGAVRAYALGAIITIALSGVEVYHHLSKSHPRKVIPDAGGDTIPTTIADAIERGAVRAWSRAMGRA
jgi:hypothetical protein